MTFCYGWQKVLGCAGCALFSVSSFAGGYGQVQEFMHRLAVQYPASTKVLSLVTNEQGDAVEYLKVGSGPTHHLIVATHHGNEYGSTEVAKAFAEDLARDPMKGMSVFILPVLNTYGYNNRVRWAMIKNKTIDPNRDYPNPCGSEGPFRMKATASLAQLLEKENIIASATLHTYHPAVVYPWGMAADEVSTAYDGFFTTLAQAATFMSHYDVGNSKKLIYGANGTFEDYAFWKQGIWSLLFELGDSHSPDTSNVKEMNRVNVPGLRRFLAQAPLQRAEKHEFSAKCTDSDRVIDRHEE